MARVRWDAALLARVGECAAMGLSMKQTASRLGVSVVSLGCYASRYKISFPRRPRVSVVSAGGGGALPVSRDGASLLALAQMRAAEELRRQIALVHVDAATAPPYSYDGGY